MKPRSRYTIEALSRGLEVLSLFRAENPSLSLTHIVTALKSGKSAIFRVLSTLESMGRLERGRAVGLRTADAREKGIDTGFKEGCQAL